MQTPRNRAVGGWLRHFQIARESRSGARGLYGLVTVPERHEIFRPKQSAVHDQLSRGELERELEQLRKEGVTVDESNEESEFGRFAWVMDPEGNRIELWEPPLAK